ncbi:MAG: methylated-DNA--[protein]-cysteine S-methyltransferase [Myxococcota bacterium]
MRVARLASPLGDLYATVDADGALASLGTAPVAGEPVELPALAAQLDRYWAREPVVFDVPLAPAGTTFQKKVWAALRDLPWGRTIPYAELARRVGSNPRAVGQANGANPVAIVVPCHRVVGSDGGLVGYAGGIEMKRFLLRLEGCLLL